MQTNPGAAGSTEQSKREIAIQGGLMWQVSPDLMCVCDLAGRFELTNPAWEAALGWTVEELSGKPYVELLHPDDVERTMAAVADCMARGEPAIRFENRHRAKDGSWRWLSWVAIASGEKLYCSARDVTADKAQADELAASVQERERAWRNARDLMVVVDKEGYFREVNPAASRVLGYAPEEMVGRLTYDFIVPEHHAGSAGALEHALKEELPGYTNRMRRKDGGERWISWVAAPEGEVVYAYGRDVTQERERDGMLDRSRARVRAIFETSYQLQGLLSPEGAVLDANRTSLAAIGAGIEQVVGKPLWETPWFAATPGAPEKAREAALAAASGESPRFEATLNVAAGPRSYEFSLRPVREASGAVVAIVTEAMDLTERKAAEETMRQAQKMEAVGQLTGGLAHDFNNLLASVSGSLELLRRRIEQRRFHELARYVDIGRGAAQRAAALTHRLLAFSRRQTLDPKPTDVGALAVGMEDMIRRSVGPTLATEVAVADGLWATLVDPPQLESALLNLSINARDAMPDGGELTIRAANQTVVGAAAREWGLEPGDYVALRVSDTGSGMSPEVLARVFEPFYTTKPLGQGTGLGLSMVYGFAKQSGGAVRIESKVGVGTTVAIYLPRYEAGVEEAREEAPADPPKGEKGQTVLVVDDEASVRTLVVDVLQDLEYWPLEAKDGASAMAILASGQRIDLLITDVGLPGGMNGRQVADAAREKRPDLPVLFITGYALGAMEGKELIGERMHVMSKPFGMDALAIRIKQLIEG